MRVKANTRILNFERFSSDYPEFLISSRKERQGWSHRAEAICGSLQPQSV